MNALPLADPSAYGEKLESATFSPSHFSDLLPGPTICSPRAVKQTRHIHTIHIANTHKIQKQEPARQLGAPSANVQQLTVTTLPQKNRPAPSPPPKTCITAGTSPITKMIGTITTVESRLVYHAKSIVEPLTMGSVFLMTML